MITNSIFLPIQFGGISLNLRVMMPPLTPMRAEAHSLDAEYYDQRANDGSAKRYTASPIINHTQRLNHA